MKYNCINCKYSTDIHCNYQKHVKSKKHVEKEKEHVILSALSTVSESVKYQCQFCERYLANPGSLTKHSKVCSAKTTYLDTIDKLKEDLIHKDELMAKDGNTICILQSEIRNLKAIINGAGSVIKTSVSSLNYITTNYKDAPALLPIADIPKLCFDLSDDDFIDQLLSEYRHKTLVAYIGNAILKQYKKSDPKQQSIWNSDSSRLTYIIREIMTNKNLDWNVDKKGIRTSKCIIDPVLSYVRNSLTDFLRNASPGTRANTTGEVVDIMMLLKETVEIMQLIDDKILEEDILRYMAPHLYVVKDGNLLLE